MAGLGSMDNWRSWGVVAEPDIAAVGCWRLWLHKVFAVERHRQAASEETHSALHRTLRCRAEDPVLCIAAGTPALTVYPAAPNMDYNHFALVAGDCIEELNTAQYRSAGMECPVQQAPKIALENKRLKLTAFRSIALFAERAYCRHTRVGYMLIATPGNFWNVKRKL